MTSKIKRPCFTIGDALQNKDKGRPTSERRIFSFLCHEITIHDLAFSEWCSIGDYNLKGDWSIHPRPQKCLLGLLTLKLFLLEHER